MFLGHITEYTSKTIIDISIDVADDERLASSEVFEVATGDSYDCTSSNETSIGFDRSDEDSTCVGEVKAGGRVVLAVTRDCNEKFVSHSVVGWNITRKDSEIF